jgi:hypothetical protein
MNGNNVDRRLEQLRVILEPDGCELCRAWVGTVLTDDTGDHSRPEVCPNCGRFVKYGQIVHLEGVSLAAL